MVSETGVRSHFSHAVKARCPENGTRPRSEGNVVFGRAAVAAAHVAGIAGVAAAATASSATTTAAPASTSTAAHELNAVSDDFGRVAVVAFLVLPLARLEATLDEDRAAL